MARKNHVSPGVYFEEFSTPYVRSKRQNIPKKYVIVDEETTIDKLYTHKLRIDPIAKEIKNGESYQFSATFIVYANNRKEREDDVTKYCTWESNVSHITVDNTSNKGLVTVRGKGGKAIITATYNDVTTTASVSVEPVITESFNVTPKSLTFATTGSTQQITAYYVKTIDDVAQPQENVTEQCTWQSNNNNITVNKGIVKPLKTGIKDATVTAVYKTFSDTATIKVEDEITNRLHLTAASTNIEMGKNGYITATYYTTTNGVEDDGTEVNNECTWASSNPDVEVSGGNVIAKKSGVKATITATYKGITSNSLTFNVKSIVTDSLVITPSTLSMAMGDRKPIIATYIVNTDGTETSTTVTTNCEWFSDNDDIVVSKGIVEAKMSGREGAIYATYKTCTSNKCNVSVSSIVDTKFNITSVINSLDKNESHTLETQFITTTDGVPSKETNVSCTWSSSDDSIISVNSTTGRITAITPGKNATITATYVRDGETYTDSITISVNDEITYRLIVDPTSIAIDKDVPYYVKAFLYTVTNGTEDNGTEKTNECTWKSSSNYIDVNKGVVTGLEYERSGYVEAIYIAPDDSELSAECEVTVNAEPKIPITAKFNVTGDTQILFNSTTNIESVTWNDIDLLESTSGKITTAKVDNGEQTITFTLKEQDKIKSSTFLGSCIKSIDFPEAIADKLKIISDGSFSNCKYLEEFTVPKNVNQLGTGVFSGSTSLTTVNFDGNVLTNKTIPNQTFKDCTSLTSVTLPESYETIGTSAFENCDSLASFTLSKDCKTIGQSAFSGCKNLETVEISEGLTTIGNSSFSSCSKLKNIVLPESLESIGDNAFENCEALESITIHENCSRIGASAYKNCKSLNNLTIDDNGVDITIDKEAFYNCDSLETVNIPNRVKEIGISCFNDCDSLTTVTGLLGLTKINNLVFYSCDKLVDITLHSGIKSIGNKSFYDCNSLESTDTIIVEGVETIGEEAFRDCDTLDVVISSTVTSIGSRAFTGLHSYYSNTYCETMYVDTGNTSYTSRNANGEECNCIMGYDRETLYFGCNNTVIPDDVKIIYDYAFYECSLFTEMELPETLTAINPQAFWACSGMLEVVFPESLEYIGSYAFQRCSSLTEIHIPKNVNYIGALAFNICSSIIKMTVDAANTTYDSRNESNCIMETSTNTLCFGCHNTIIPDDTVIIGNNAFEAYKNLTEITLPETLTTIKESAFQSCSGITALYIPKNVSLIDEKAFVDADGLLTIDVDSENAYYDNRDDGQWIVDTNKNMILLAANIDYTELSPSITSMGSNVFCHNNHITEFIIHDNVTNVGYQCFSTCKNLSKITIGAKVSKIDTMAFYACSSLSEIIINAAIAPSIGYAAFNGVPKDGTISYPEGSDYSEWKKNTYLEGWFK